MNSDAPRPEKVLPQADESRSGASTNSYYQLLLQKCRSRRTTRVVQGSFGSRRRDAGEALVEIGRSYNVSHSTISRL
jgi:hypothetical protein